MQNAWLSNTFNYSQEKYLLGKYTKFFSKELHATRLNNLIWKKQWGSASRQLKRVNKDIKALSQAKILLARRRGNVDNAIKKIPKSLINEESIVYERIKWRRRAKLEEKSLELLLSYNGPISQSKKWWREVNYHTRKQIRYEKYDTAIDLLKQYIANTSDYSAEANWLAGWLSLTFKKDPSNSYEYFKEMFRNVITPISKARASYWAGKSAEALSDYDGANLWYTRSAAYPATFYGQLATKVLNKQLFMPTSSSTFSKEEYLTFKESELSRCLIADSNSL